MARRTRSKSIARVESPTNTKARKSRIVNGISSETVKKTSRSRSRSPASTRKKVTRSDKNGDDGNDITHERQTSSVEILKSSHTWDTNKNDQSKGRGNDSKPAARKASSKGSDGEKIVVTCPEDLPFPEIYFGGCAFGSAFYCGVYRALYEKYDFTSLLAHGLTLSGGSAGACFAVYIALGFTPMK